MNAIPPDASDEPELDILLRDLFRQAGEPPMTLNLAARAIELSRVPQTAAARFVRRCVVGMNILGCLLLATVVWNGAQNVMSTLDSTSSSSSSAQTTSETTGSSTTTSTTTGLEIAGAAMLLCAAAGTQWAFRAPGNGPYLLTVTHA